MIRNSVTGSSGQNVINHFPKRLTCTSGRSAFAQRNHLFERDRQRARGKCASVALFLFSCSLRRTPERRHQPHRSIDGSSPARGQLLVATFDVTLRRLAAGFHCGQTPVQLRLPHGILSAIQVSDQSRDLQPFIDAQCRNTGLNLPKAHITTLPNGKPVLKRSSAAISARSWRGCLRRG